MTETNLAGRLAEAWWSRRHPEWAGKDDGALKPRLDLRARAVPRYVFDRLEVRARNMLKGQQPWITEHARALLDQLLRPTDRGLEYGAGGTTPFFAARVGFLDSVEGFDHWYEPLARRLAADGVDNVALHLVSADQLGYESPEHRSAYVNVRPDLEPGSLDFVFVDGEYRDDCALRGIDLLRSGGLLILDNATTYLPAATRSPWRVERPVTPGWEEFTRRVEQWRCLWTTNGVWDTAIWVKP